MKFIQLDFFSKQTSPWLSIKIAIKFPEHFWNFTTHIFTIKKHKKLKMNRLRKIYLTYRMLTIRVNPRYIKSLFLYFWWSISWKSNQNAQITVLFYLFICVFRWTCGFWYSSENKDQAITRDDCMLFLIFTLYLFLPIFLQVWWKNGSNAILNKRKKKKNLNFKSEKLILRFELHLTLN